MLNQQNEQAEPECKALIMIASLYIISSLLT